MRHGKRAKYIAVTGTTMACFRKICDDLFAMDGTNIYRGITKHRNEQMYINHDPKFCGIFVMVSKNIWEVVKSFVTLKLKCLFMHKYWSLKILFVSILQAGGISKLSLIRKKMAVAVGRYHFREEDGVMTLLIY